MEKRNSGNIGVLILFLLLIFLLFALVFLAKRQFRERLNLGRNPPRDFIPRTLRSQDSNKVSENPFGVMLASAGMSTQTKIQTAKNLGVIFYRPNDVNPQNVDKCDLCDAAKNAGFKLVLTIRNTPPGPRAPANPPENLSRYKSFVSQALDRYQPYLLVVENEPNSQLFYTGNADQYLAELKVACEVAHSKGYKCTDGGMVGSLTISLVADEYERQGQTQKADEYLRMALDKENYQKIVRGKNTPVYQKQIEFGRTLLQGAKSSGADYINFHWYSSSPQAFEEAVRFLEAKTGLSTVTNEMGQQKTTNPSQVTAMMQKVVDLKLPVAIWFSADIPAFGQAKGLTNEDGTLRENGQAFKNFIEQNF